MKGKHIEEIKAAHAHACQLGGAARRYKTSTT